MQSAHSLCRAFALALLVVSLPAVAAPAAPEAEQADTLRLVRLHTADAEALRLELLAEGYGVDCTHARHGHPWLDIIVSVEEQQALHDRGLNPTLLETGRPFNEIQAERNAEAAAGAPDGAVPNGYSDLAGLLAEMNTIASNFPNLAQVVNVTQAVGGPQTVEGRDIFALKISDNVATDEDEPEMLVVSAHHVREIVTPVIALHAADRFTQDYGSVPQITNLVDNYEIWIVPTWNPDGYNEVFVGDNFWRKNRRVFPQGVGVDLNRNYPQGWDNACSGSTQVTSQTYKGPSVASEAETQVMLLWSDARRFVKVIDYHSSGEEALYGYACPSHPFGSWLEGEAIALSSASGYGGAVRGPSADGEHYEWQLAQLGVHSFLIETHTTFQPSFASAQAEATTVFPGIQWMLERPISLSGHVTDSVSGNPLEADVELVGVGFSANETNSSGGAFGRYHQIMPAGSYNVRFSATGYQPQTIPVNVTSNSAQILDVALVPDSPPIIGFAFPSGLPSLLAPGGQTILVRVQEFQPGGLVPGSAMLHYDAGPGTVSGPLNPLSGDLYEAIFPALDCGTDVTFWFTAEDSAMQTVTSPPGAPALRHSALVGSAVQIAFDDNFQTNQMWTTEILGATSGQWERGVPVNDPSWAHDPESDGDGSGQCYLTENAIGNTDVDNGSVRLNSPRIDMSAGGVDIDYLYYLKLTTPAGDPLVVEISSNGLAGPWIEIARHETDGGLAWRAHQITQDDLNAAGVVLTSTMNLRFTATDGEPQSIVEAGIDGVMVSTLVCVTCNGDVNGDNVVNVFDLLVALGSWGPCPGCPADLNGDGVVNVFDLLEILGNWGPC